MQPSEVQYGQVQVFALELRQSKHKYRLGKEWRREQLREEIDLEVLVDERLNIGQRCVLAARNANHVLSCIGGGMVRGDDYSPSPGVLCPVLGPPAQEGHQAVGHC